MMRTNKFLLLMTTALLLTMSSCKTIKQTSKYQTDQQVSERTVSELVKSEVERTIASFSQTVIEFYPEMSVCGGDTLATPSYTILDKSAIFNGRSTNNVSSVTPLHPLISVNQPIKRLLRTDIGVNVGKSSQTEANMQKESVAHAHTTSESQIIEKPPASNFVEIALYVICGLLLLFYIVYYLFLNRYRF